MKGNHVKPRDRVTASARPAFVITSYSIHYTKLYDSGSSLQSDSGRQALKMHGPSENEVNSTNWDRLKSRTEYTIISDNIFGSSGPWPVSLGPQNEQEDERLSNIIFERNRYCGDFGKRSSASFPLDTAFLFYGSSYNFV